MYSKGYREGDTTPETETAVEMDRDVEIRPKRLQGHNGHEHRCILFSLKGSWDLRGILLATDCTIYYIMSVVFLATIIIMMEWTIPQNIYTAKGLEINLDF